MLLLDRYSDWLFERFQGKIKGDFEIDRNELKKVRQLHIIMVSVSAFFGAFFIMLYYLPIHWYGDYFNAHVIHLSLFGFSFDLFWLKQLDSIVLTILELYLLGMVTVYSIQRLGYILDFPSKEIHAYELHKENMRLISLQKKQKKELELGLNPYHGMPKLQLYFYIIISRAKAALSNFLLKFFLQRFGSRYILKIFIDLAAMPVYAFWNAISSHRLYVKAKYYMFSVQLIEAVTRKLDSKEHEDKLKEELESLLSFIVVLKRDFSEINHYYSTRLIEATGTELTRENKAFQLESRSQESHLDLLLLLFATGIILDGTISGRERRYIKRVVKKFENPPQILVEIDDYLMAYKQGAAVEFLVSKGYL